MTSNHYRPYEGPSPPQRQLASPVAAERLDSIKAHLDILLLALESIAGITSDDVVRAAIDLKLEEVVGDRVTLWRLRQSSPLRKGKGRKKLDVEEAQGLVFIICHLAADRQERIRRAVNLLEQAIAESRPPHQTALLGDYLDAFTNNYQERLEDPQQTPEVLGNLALKLLVDLLFYSGSNGRERLWIALFESSVR